MENIAAQLPWGSLTHAEGDIPWPALYKFAAAVVNDKSVADELFDLYEHALDAAYERPCYADLYVPAIFALAAPRLTTDRRRAIGGLSLEKLDEAGRRDADLLIEAWTAACGCMGPVILPMVLQTIAKQADHRGAWFHLWGLTELAAKSQDAELRSQVVEACMKLLRRADSGQIEPTDAIDAAWTLAAMKQTDCKSLLRRLRDKSGKAFGYADFEDAYLLLEGRLNYTPQENLWEMPVKNWLQYQWQTVRDWYARQQDNGGEDEMDVGIRRAGELTAGFLGSPEAAKLTDEPFEDAGLIAHCVLEYAWVYAGSSAEELDEHTLEQVLLEEFPRKLTAERELFEKVVPVTEALLGWMESEGILADTARLVGAVRGWADRIVANAMDPQYWGMAKSFMMQARAEGVDTENEEALRWYMVEYNLRQLMAKNAAGLPEPQDSSPPIPIVEQSPKIGRNQPCPCGSGKKYKKCCGRVGRAER